MSTDRSRRGLTDDDASSLLSLDPCAVLGVGPDASARDLRKAYRRALLAAHPDQGGSREELDLVRSAYARLRDAAPADRQRPAGTAAATDSTPVSSLRQAFVDAAGPSGVAADRGESAPVAPSAVNIPTAPTASPEAPFEPTTSRAGAAAAAKFATAQRFATHLDDAAPKRRRRSAGRARGRFEQLLERELVRRSERRVRLVGSTDQAGART